MARNLGRAKLLNVNHEVIRRIPINEALGLVREGDAVILSSRSSAQLAVMLVSARKTDARNETSITFAEMEANTGLRGSRRRARSRDYVGNFVDRAMTKIEIWPEIGDTRAIRVGARATL